jgi:hypothetical protein
MSDAPRDPRRFFTETIPEQFNRTLADTPGSEGREAGAGQDRSAPNGTIRVEVRGEGGGTFFLNIREGRMDSDEVPLHSPFLTLIQERRCFERMVRETGESTPALLGDLAGLAGDMRLTRARVEQLSAIRGTVRLAVSGERGFALLAHFGPEPVAEEADTSISVDSEALGELRAGGLDAAKAFLDGKIDIEGDMKLAMRVALAAWKSGGRWGRGG